MVESTAIRGEISTRIYDPAILTYHDPTYPALPRAAQGAVAREHDPIHSDTSSNVTCVGLHTWLAEALDGATVMPPEPNEFALGRSNTAPTSDDTELTDEVDRVDVTAFDVEGSEVRITAYVGEGEANVDVEAGETISEGGVYAGSRLLNHSLFDIEYEKDSQKTMSVDAAFTFSSTETVQP